MSTQEQFMEALARYDEAARKRQENALALALDKYHLAQTEDDMAREAAHFLLAESRPDGAINGKNEAERKAQHATKLPKMSLRYAGLVEGRTNYSRTIIDLQHEVDTQKDEMEREAFLMRFLIATAGNK